MKHFFVNVNCVYDGYEWGQGAVIHARSARSAQNKADRTNWTHGDTIRHGEHVLCELQRVGTVREIPEAHAVILAEYLVSIT